MLCVYPFSLEGGINLIGAKLIWSFDCYWTIIKHVELALISADPTPANSTTYTDIYFLIVIGATMVSGPWFLFFINKKNQEYFDLMSQLTNYDWNV